jgi:hypothetical protein
MRIVERVTRDKASRFVWGGLTLLCALGLVYAVQGEERALQDEIGAANARTARYANTVVYELVAAPTVSSPEVEFRFRDMLVAAQAEVFTDPTVARMRLWDLDGVLRFSTDQPRADIGALQVEDPRVDEAALEGRSSFTQTTEPFTQATTGRAGEPTRLLQTFVPLTVPDRIEPLGAVQIDYLYDTLVEASREPWLQVQVLAAAALGLFALMTLLSLRKPIPRAVVVGAAEVPVAATPAAAAPASASAGATAEPDGAVALREELELAREQLVQAEEAYHYLEARLKKSQEEVSKPDDEPAPEIQEQIAVVERDRAMAEARAELAEQRLGEMQRRLERLSRDPSAPPQIVTDAVPVASNGDHPEPAEADGPVVRQPAEAPEPPTSEREPEPAAEPAPARGSERVGASVTDEDTSVAASDAATELRARLARTAARKKLGPNVTD